MKDKEVKIFLDIPNKIKELISKLRDGGYEAWLVGGCVRDLILNKKPKDWDITTNAKPEEIQKIFEHSFYENDFGTVGVVNDSIVEEIKKIEEQKEKEEDDKKIKEFEEKIFELESLKVVEVTPYRIEGKYSDNRRPDEVVFSKNLEDDLKRRDFTINAFCYNPLNNVLIDLFDGISDLRKKEIKAVGNADERFKEDALRILRAIRFSAQLSFEIEEETAEAIKKNSKLLENISMERIREEFVNILMTDNPIEAFFKAKDLEVLKYLSPDLERGIGVEQNGMHRYDVFEHLLRTMQHSADRNWSLIVRLASLFHDISKPETRRWSEKKKNWTFYGHEVVGARVTKKNLERLKFDKKTIDKVTLLVRWHMFFSDPDKITLSAVRRIIRNVGEENVWDLIKLRISDRIGMGRPKEKPYRLRQYLAMMEEAMRSPISVKDLKINGDILISELGMKPGRKIGYILNALMSLTLDNPENNNYEFLLEKSKEFLKMKDEELIKIAERGKIKIEEKEEEELKKIKKKHKVNY